MTEPETVDALTGLVEAGERFVHVRFGDGDVFFATGTGPKRTADGEEWSQELAERLRRAWRSLACLPGLILGDVASYAVSDGCEAQWDELFAELLMLRPVEYGPPPLVHIEALRAIRGHALPFYRAVAASTMRKVFVGPARLAGAARMLRAAHVEVPLGVAHLERHVGYAVESVIGAPAGYELALVAAGRGGKIIQARLAEYAPALAQVDVGSGLDCLFDGVVRGTDRPEAAEAAKTAYYAAGLLHDR